MTALSDAAESAFDDYVTSGVPGSGVKQPDKAAIRSVFRRIDSAISSLGVSGAITVKKATKALLDADLAHAADTLAIVYDDATAANNGIYAKSGGSGSGSWTLTDVALPGAFADDLEAAEGRLDDLEVVTGTVENAFPGKDLSTAVYFNNAATVPTAFRTSEAAALGLVTGASRSGGACYVGAALDRSLADPYAFIRAYIEVGEGEDNTDLPANVYANFFGGAFTTYEQTVELTYQEMIGTRLAVYTFQGAVSTSGEVASVNVGWDATKPNCVIGGIQASIRPAAIPDIAVGDYPAIASAALPPTLHLTAGRAVSLDVRAVLPEATGEIEVTWSSSQSSAPRKPWFAHGPVIDLDPSRVGSTVDVRVRQTVGSAVVRWGRQITVDSASASTSSATPKILLLGDSLLVRQMAYLVNADLVARGMTPEWVGTVKGWGSGSSYDGPFGEARGGRRFTDYTGQTSDLSPPPASSAAYLAADNDGRIALNPFLRAATGGDPAEWSFDIGGTDYIFDLDHYLTTYAGTDANRNVDTPDFVLICLGTNDYLLNTEDMVSGVELGFDILYGQTRDALPTAHIGFISPALGYGPLDEYRLKAHQVRRAIMAKVAAERTGGDTSVYFLDWAIRQNVDAGWAETASYTDATGNIAYKMTDDIHFEGVNRYAAADVLGSFIRARV